MDSKEQTTGGERETSTATDLKETEKGGGEGGIEKATSHTTVERDRGSSAVPRNRRHVKGDADADGSPKVYSGELRRLCVPRTFRFD